MRVAEVPKAGDIVHADEMWEEPAGGGAGAAVQLLKLSGNATFFTALGDDETGRETTSLLTAQGLRVAAVERPRPTRRAFTHVDADGERTITVLGDRLHPRGDDPLPWARLDETDAVYVTAGDIAAIEHARRARVLVATSRILPLLQAANVQLDAIVGSHADPSETYVDGNLEPAPHLIVRTMGGQGGTVQRPGEKPEVFAAAPLPGPIKDRYGAGDSFAAALTYALAEGQGPLDAAAFAARCGAAVLTGRGPYEGQLTRSQLP